MKILTVGILLWCCGLQPVWAGQQSAGVVTDLKVQWGAMIAELAEVPVQHQLERIQEFFSGVVPTSDQSAWGQKDYWASPDELLAKGKGDCEDIAIAKYFTLRQLGVADEKLRLMFARRMNAFSGRIEPHLVLAFDDDQHGWVVLDNLVSAVSPMDERRDLMFEFGFNADSIWEYRRAGQFARLGSSGQVVRWADMTARMGLSG